MSFSSSNLAFRKVQILFLGPYMDPDFCLQPTTNFLHVKEKKFRGQYKQDLTIVCRIIGRSCFEYFAVTNQKFLVAQEQKSRSRQGPTNNLHLPYPLFSSHSVIYAEIKGIMNVDLPRQKVLIAYCPTIHTVRVGLWAIESDAKQYCTEWAKKHYFVQIVKKQFQLYIKPSDQTLVKE